MSETLVRLEGVSRHYATLKALDDVDLTIARGEWLAVMGPSGSGKSTLMHLLGALDTPTAGRVWVDGVEVSALDESARARFRREKVGIVFQQFHLLPTSPHSRTSWSHSTTTRSPTPARRVPRSTASVSLTALRTCQASSRGASNNACAWRALW